MVDRIETSFAAYAAQIVSNARALADGLVRRGAELVTGGTDNHLVLIDVATIFGLTGRQAEAAADHWNSPPSITEIPHPLSGMAGHLKGPPNR